MNLLKLPEVIEITALSKTTIYRQLGMGAFPIPIRVGLRAIRWHAHEIQDWVDSRQRASAKNFDLNTS